MIAKLSDARATLCISAIATAVLLSGCGGSGGGGGKPWAATVCKSLKPTWSTASGNYQALMKSLNDPGADPGVGWDTVASELKGVGHSFLTLLVTSASTSDRHAGDELAGATFQKGDNAVQALELDTTTWAAGIAPPGQGVGGDPSIGLSEVHAAVQEFCG